MPPKHKNKSKNRGREIKSKYEDKPEDDLIELNGKRISLMRFAYDVFRYSALKFHVPEECISVWTDGENDYGYSDFCSVVSSLIIGLQIRRRVEVYKQFKKHRKTYKLDSVKRIFDLFSKVMKTETSKLKDDVMEDTQYSLVTGCELIIFLFSIESPLYVEELAKYWFTCHFHSKKRSFESTGGLAALYGKGEWPKQLLEDSSFYNKFISKFCIPYLTSVSTVNLASVYIKWSTDLELKMLAFNSTEDGQPKREEVMLNSPSAGCVRVPSHPVVTSPLPTKHDEASGLDISMNPGFGILQHENLLGTLDGPHADTPFNNLLRTRFQKPVRSCKESSGQNGRNREAFSSVEQCRQQSSLDSSSAMRSNVKTPSVQVVNYPAPSQSSAGAKPKKPTKQPVELSGKQKSKFRSLAIVEESFGRMNLDSSRDDMLVNPGLGIPPHEDLLRSLGTLVSETPSQNLDGASPQKPSRRRKETSRKQAR